MIFSQDERGCNGLLHNNTIKRSEYLDGGDDEFGKTEKGIRQVSDYHIKNTFYQQ